SNRQRQRIQRSLSLDESSASAQRAASLREAGFAPEGLTAVGLENSLAERVRGGLVETMKSSVRVGYGSPAGLRMVYRPSELLPGRGILDLGGPNLGSPQGRTKAIGDLRSRCRRVQPPDGAG